MRRTLYIVFFGLLVLHLVSACSDGGRQDSDNDGLSDRDEILFYKTDPNNADTDADGRSDGDELLAGSNPLVADVGRALILNNTASRDVKVYIVFIGGLTASGGSYTAQDFQSQGCDVYRPDRCSLTVPKGTSKTLNLHKGCINLSGGLDNEPMGPCPTTMFEINICPPDNRTYDHFDLSLVNGFNYSMQVSSSRGPATRQVMKATGNHDAVGVYPLGCTMCIGKGSMPPAWPSCPGNSSSCGAQCFNTNECKSGPDDKHPNAACDLQAATEGSFTVKFGDASP